MIEVTSEKCRKSTRGEVGLGGDSVIFGPHSRAIVRARKIITAETAEGAEMIGGNDLLEQPLRALRALR